MGLSTAERNRRKRERKKKEREAERKRQEALSNQQSNTADEPEIEIEYVTDDVQITADNAAVEAVRRFQARVDATLEPETDETATNVIEQQLEEEEIVSKTKLRAALRPSVAELKRRVDRPDLVEAHDVAATDPDFLLELKAVPNTVPIPRHWGRKRRYLQGKRGFEKKPFRLPPFLVKTGISELRDTNQEAEAEQSAKQKNRSRVNPKMGAIDVDYRTMHDAFFKYQTKPKHLTGFADVYYEGREGEPPKIQPGQPLSAKLREALGMTLPSSPPPWLINMQRYGLPPSFPGLKVPGLNAPLPDSECHYGYHPNGWGKPPVDQYQRPLFGGNPFDPPGSKATGEKEPEGGMVTSDGKKISKAPWGALPTGEESDEESSSDEDMEESSDEESEAEAQEEETGEPEPNVTQPADDTVLPPPSIPAAPLDLRKSGGDSEAPKQLYTVIESKQASGAGNAVFASEVTYQVPGKGPEGAESVLAKAAPAKDNNKTGRQDDDEEDEEELGKNFKF